MQADAASRGAIALTGGLAAIASFLPRRIAGSECGAGKRAASLLASLCNAGGIML
jgi:hypothetical protein